MAARRRQLKRVYTGRIYLLPGGKMNDDIASEMDKGKCPVCAASTSSIHYDRATVTRRSGAVGASAAPQTVEIPVVHLVTTFDCGCVVMRVLEDGRWSRRVHDPENECANAQEVALRLRQELNDARTRETTDAG